jgi:rSAM/selenodomain-associated transferase 1
MEKKSNKLLIFTKAPILGEVKTRLQPDYSVEQSLKLHKKLVINTLTSISDLSDFHVELCCAPNRQHMFFLDCEKRFPIQLSDQLGDDLGERMAFAFSSALQLYEKVIIVGTDCPDLNGEYVNNALKALDDFDAVMGPAEDGGYVLLGLKKFSPALFTDILWGSDVVFKQTKKVLTELSWSCHELGIMYDVDRSEDLQRYKNLLTDII